MTKEKPIPFSADMVKAILDGRKTVTRRVIKLKEFGLSDTPGYDWQFRDRRMLWNEVKTERLLELAPYQVGDLLWVKQALWESECGKYFAYDGYEHADVVRISDGRFYYGGDTRDPINGKPAHRFMVGGYSNRDTGKGCHKKHRFVLGIGEYDTTMKIESFTGNTEISSLDILFTKKLSSRFMFKKFARTWLEVVSERPERLQDITEEDAIAEGIVTGSSAMGHVFTAKEHFKGLWDSLNAKRGYPWESNPWVWRIEFQEYPK